MRCHGGWEFTVRLCNLVVRVCAAEAVRLLACDAGCYEVAVGKNSVVTVVMSDLYVVTGCKTFKCEFTLKNGSSCVTFM